MFEVPSLWREYVAIASRRPRPSAHIAASYPQGHRYSASQGPVTSVLVPVMIIGFLGDIPLSWVVITLSHPSHPWLIHSFVLAAGLWSVGWALAVRSVIQAVPHVIDHSALWLGAHARYAGCLARSSVVRVHVLQESRYAWAAAHQVSMRDVRIVSGLDSPNVPIELEPSAFDRVRLTRNGKAIPPRRWILLYADHPREMAAAL